MPPKLKLTVESIQHHPLEAITNAPVRVSKLSFADAGSEAGSLGLQSILVVVLLSVVLEDCRRRNLCSAPTLVLYV